MSCWKIFTPFQLFVKWKNWRRSESINRRKSFDFLKPANEINFPLLLQRRVNHLRMKIGTKKFSLSRESFFIARRFYFLTTNLYDGHKVSKLGNFPVYFRSESRGLTMFLGLGRSRSAHILSAADEKFSMSFMTTVISETRR